VPVLKPVRGIRLNKSHPFARGLVGYWLFNEGSGNKVFDLSGNGNGNGNEGVLIADTHWVPGKFGSALDFDGIGDYVDTGIRTNYGKKVTFVTWVNFDDNQVRGQIISSLYWTDNEFVFQEHNGADNQFLFGLGLNKYVTWVVPFDITSTWVSLIVVIDTTQAANADKLKLYANGVLVAQATFTGITTEDVEAASNNILIGNSLNGQIDHVPIYNRILSASEIAQLYREPFCMFERGINQVLLYTEVGGVNYEDLLLGVSVSASVAKTDEQQMVDTEKAVGITGSVTKIDNQQMMDTNKAITFAASISETDTQQMVDTSLGVTVAASLGISDNQQMVDTNKTVTFAAGVSVADTRQMFDTNLDVTMVASINEVDTQQMLDTVLGVTFAANVSEIDMQQMKDLLKAITFAASCGIETEVYYDASAAVFAMFAFVVLRQHTS